MQFQGLAAPMTEGGFTQSLSRLGVPAASLWAVLSVETAGCGYLDDRRPMILFERHHFHSLTAGRFDRIAPDLSQPTPGGYGEAGAFQYARLARALVLDQTAALQSTSWGLGQVLGSNAGAAGFADVRAMVAAFMLSEDAQLAAMALFAEASGLAPALRNADWRAFAERYNGPSYRRLGYDTRLSLAHARWQVGPLPDLGVRWLQMALRFCGIQGVGPVDGWLGPSTRQALASFQRQNGLPARGESDPATRRALAQRLGWAPA